MLDPIAIFLSLFYCSLSLSLSLANRTACCFVRTQTPTSRRLPLLLDPAVTGMRRLRTRAEDALDATSQLEEQIICIAFLFIRVRAPDRLELVVLAAVREDEKDVGVEVFDACFELELEERARAREEREGGRGSERSIWCKR